MKWLIYLGVLCAQYVCASEYAYVPFEKTYIDPRCIHFQKNTIIIKTQMFTCQTSAIYSDQNGFYFLDVYRLIEEEAEFEFFDDSFSPVEEPAPLNSKPTPEIEPITEQEEPPPREEAPSPSKPPPPPTSQPPAWPYIPRQR